MHTGNVSPGESPDYRSGNVLQRSNQYLVTSFRQHPGASDQQKPQPQQFRKIRAVCLFA
jgi:hypothetical protein